VGKGCLITPDPERLRRITQHNQRNHDAKSSLIRHVTGIDSTTYEKQPESHDFMVDFQENYRQSDSS